MTTRQTEFSRSLQGTAQDLQRIQQVISGLTDTIRGVSREFASLLSGINQQAGGAPISQVASSFITPRGDQLGRELLGSAQQRLLDDIARYNSSQAQSRITAAEQSGAAEVAQGMRVAEINAIRSGQRAPNYAFIEGMYGRDAIRNARRFRVASSLGGNTEAEAVAFSAQQRLKEGMSVPEVSLLLQQNLNKEQLESFRGMTSDFGPLARKMAGVQTMVGLPSERIQTRIAADLEKARSISESSARQMASESLERQRIEAHRSLRGGYSSEDRSRAIQLSAVTGDRSLSLSFGDMRRAQETNIGSTIEQANKQMERLRSSSSGLDRAAALEIQRVVEELKLLRSTTEKADKKLHDAIASGAKPGEVRYEKLIEDLKKSIDKQTQAQERAEDVLRSGQGGPTGGGGIFDKVLGLGRGLGQAIGGVAPIAAAGFNLHQAMLESNIGANRRAMGDIAGIAQLQFSRYMGTADMTKVDNLIKYRADLLLPKTDADALRYIGTQRRNEAMSEAQRETNQRLELLNNQALGNKVAAGVNTVAAGGSAVIGVATGNPLALVASGHQIGSAANQIRQLEANRLIQMEQGGLAGGIIGTLDPTLSRRRLDLYKKENMRAATLATSRETLQNFEELMDTEAASRPALRAGIEQLYGGLEAYERGTRTIGRTRALRGTELFTSDRNFVNAQTRFESESIRSGQITDYIRSQPTSGSPRINSILRGWMAGEGSGAFQQSASSSAYGLYQFTKGTVNPILRELGISRSDFEGSPEVQHRVAAHYASRNIMGGAAELRRMFPGLSEAEYHQVIPRLGLGGAKEALAALQSGGTYVAKDNDVIVKDGQWNRNMMKRFREENRIVSPLAGPLNAETLNAMISQPDRTISQVTGDTLAAQRGMSIQEFTNLGNTMMMYMGPGQVRGNLVTPDIVSRRLGQTARLADMSAAGLGAPDQLMGNLANLNIARGGADNLQALEQVMSRAVATGFDNARLGQQFVNTVTSLADNLQTTDTEGLGSRLATAANFMSNTFGRADERSLRAAAGGVAEWGAFSSQAGGLMGQAKIHALLSGGVDFRKGLGTIMNASEDQIVGWRKQLQDNQITDPALKELVAMGNDPAKLRDVLGKVSQAQLRVPTIAGNWLGGTDQMQDIDRLLKMARGKDETEDQFKARQEMEVRRVMGQGAQAGVMMRGLGARGGRVAVSRLIQERALALGIPEDQIKDIGQYIQEEVYNDPSRVVLQRVTQQLTGTQMARKGRITEDQINARLENGGIFTTGRPGGDIDKDVYRQFKEGALSKERAAEIKEFFSRSSVEVGRSILDNRMRDAVTGTIGDTDPAQVSRLTNEAISDFSAKVKRLADSISNAMNVINDRVARIK